MLDKLLFEFKVQEFLEATHLPVHLCACGPICTYMTHDDGVNVYSADAAKLVKKGVLKTIERIPADTPILEYIDGERYYMAALAKHL